MIILVCQGAWVAPMRATQVVPNVHAPRQGVTLQNVAAQAADIVRLVGIGRNEYIATMNKCKAKKLLWRVNRAIVKDLLPTEQLETEKQDWWTAHVVNIGTALSDPAQPQRMWLSVPHLASRTHLCQTSTILQRRHTRASGSRQCLIMSDRYDLEEALFGRQGSLEAV